MTKKKTRYKSALPSLLVVLLCLCVCAGSLWLFYKDVTSSSFRTDKEPVATITFKYKIAQRKYSDRVIWERLKQHSPLYNGDTVHTADMALATINFNNGVDIKIDENTMVQILVSKDGKVKLSVNSGKIEADTTNSTEDILLDMGNETVVNMQKGSKVSAMLDESKEGAAIKLLAGGAAIENSQGMQNAKLGAGETVKVYKSGEITKNLVTVTSISENQRILLFGESENSVPLEWFPIEGAYGKNVIVETSGKKDFSMIRDTFAVADTNKVDLPASDGILYWRVHLEGDEKIAVQGKLNFEEIAPIECKLPQNQDTLTYYKDAPIINLAWKGNEFAQKYKVEISKDSNFATTEIERETSSQNLVLGDLPDGKYFWRVTPYYKINGIGYQGTSEPKTFSIARKDKMQPPQLSFPPNGNKIAYKDARFEMDFSWKAENVESEYTLQIARDKNFDDLILDQKTPSKNLRKTFFASDFPAGEYYWKVWQTSEAQNFASETRSFFVEKYTPEQNRLLFPDDSYSVEKDKLNAIAFMWKISKENQNEFESQKTVLQFSKTENFADIAFQKETNAAELKNINLEEGKYFWRVVKGQSQSDVRSIFVLGELAAPQILAPAVQEKFLFENATASNVNVRWKKTSGADFYNLKIIDSEANSVVKEIAGLAEESASVPINVSAKEKKFVVQIQAFTNETKLSGARKSKVAEVVFLAKTASPVRLVTPAARAQFEGLAALKDGVNLTWAKGDDSYSTAELLLWSVGTGGRTSLVNSFKNPRESVNVGSLAAGNYRWTVKASAKNGAALDAKETRDFTVLDVPNLTPPVLGEPYRNQRIGAEYLEKNRSITFNWSAVSGATDYDFVLYQKFGGSLRRIYSVENTNSTQITIRDLTIFDIGNFQWQVTAKNRAQDGFVYQNSGVAIQDFGIYFDVPGDVETLDPGEIYGE